MKILQLALHALREVDADEDFSEYLDRLRFFFNENLLLAALDLIDRDSVIKFTTPWGHSLFQVLGSTATYSVFPSDPNEYHSVPAYCTCSSFAHAVLLSNTQLMCKHLLATYLAQRIGRYIERSVDVNDLAEVSVRQAALS